MQKVQDEINYYQELNEIEGIGYNQQRVREKTQVLKHRDRVKAIKSSQSIYANTTAQITGFTFTTGGEFNFRKDNDTIQIPVEGDYIVMVNMYGDDAATIAYGAWAYVRNNGSNVYRIMGGLRGLNGTCLLHFKKNDMVTLFMSNDLNGYYTMHDIEITLIKL